ncbi:techylectin-5B [Trichonephila clavata]|uniref:Techylectin-5B n=1 Tax=Trichonephila clavata TaxID=2740835 RepID=A0A8X6F3E0_TRICU|nr:techylectin-5B [Trichonephila clavata]
MSYHKCTRKEDLINVLNEIGEQVSSKETIFELKTKLENSKLFKDDPEFVMNMINLSIEDKQSKAEQQLQITNSQLELEKIKLQQKDREIELQKAKAEGNVTQKSLQGETNYLENLIKSDSMSERHNSQKFTTKDQDNDAHKEANCAAAFKGAWWYGVCHHSNLNGLYLRGAHERNAEGVNWLTFKGHKESLDTTEMKIRSKSFRHKRI